MRTSIQLLLVFSIIGAKSQNCACEKDTFLKEIISCDTSKFKNGALIYWRYNCDSSWLTFESKKGKKQNLFTLDEGMQHLTGRLGYVSWEEFKNTFIVQNNVISGSGSPQEYYLHDKETGKLKKKLGRLLYVSNNGKYPITIGLINSNYEETIQKPIDYIVVQNIDKNIITKIPLKKGEIENAQNKFEVMYPEYLFDFEDNSDETKVIMNYRVFEKGKEKNKKIIIDLTKYSR